MPGKFEGEPKSTEHFFDQAMEGMQDEVFIDFQDKQIDVFKIDSTDRADFPNLQGYTHIIIYEDDQGFAYHELANGRRELFDTLDTMGVSDWQIDEADI